MSKAVYKIFKEIEETSGKNDKVAIIKKNEDNEEFKKFLRFLYDDTITTGLSSKKINKKIAINGVATVRAFDDVPHVMDFLTRFNTGSDSIILAVQSFINNRVVLDGLKETVANEEYNEFLRQVFTKSYKCGITASSVNKALGNDFIKEFKVQLAHPYEKYANKVKSKFYLTQKLDGHRTLVRINMAEDKVTFWTRKGHEIHGLTEIEQDIRELIFPILEDTADIVYDGEITVVNDHEVGDVFSATSKIVTKKDGDKTGLKFNVFDIVSYEEFVAGVSEYDYECRRTVLDVIFLHIGALREAFPCFVNTPVLYAGEDIEEIAKWSNWATDNGHEGVMLNMADGLYETKRTPNLLKVKKFHSADILCTGVFEGEGKLAGSLGGIYVNYKGSKVGVGTGFAQEQRDFYWNNINEVIGKVVEIKYFEESKNQNNDDISLRFPVFVGVRDDKTEADINID